MHCSYTWVSFFLLNYNGFPTRMSTAWSPSAAPEFCMEELTSANADDSSSSLFLPLSLSLLASSAEDNVLYCNGNETHKKNANDSSILFIDRIIWLYRYKEMPWRGESKRCLQGAKTKGYLYNPEGGSKGWAQQKTTREPLQRMRILACMNAKQLMHTHISLIWPWLTKWLITHAGSFPRSCAHHHWAELEHACETQQHNWILGHAWTLEACAELYNDDYCYLFHMEDYCTACVELLQNITMCCAVLCYLAIKLLRAGLASQSFCWLAI